MVVSFEVCTDSNDTFRVVRHALEEDIVDVIIRIQQGDRPVIMHFKFRKCAWKALQPRRGGE